jgi:hypothetical protein
LAGEFGIVPYPIVLTLVFPAAPNLRIVDLPGICQHPKKGQPENIKDLTTNLVSERAIGAHHKRCPFSHIK